jgi:ribosomal protein S18 acetylase RimI-like enzyme
MGPVVRRAEPAELEAVGHLTAEAYLHDGFVSAEHEYVDELRDAVGRAGDTEIYVAADGDDLLGTVTFCPAGSTFAEVAQPGQGEFRMLAVAAHARGRGIAEALVRTCVERSRELGYSELALSSMAEMKAAHRLYARLGFRRHSELDWSPVDGVKLLGFILRLD